LEPEVKEINRLTQTAYEHLVKGLPATGCPKTDLEAGFMCGVQHVLAKLREGFVIG
jgi:hypothetical protein